jgi:hypothetical protein
MRPLNLDPDAWAPPREGQKAATLPPLTFSDRSIVEHLTGRLNQAAHEAGEFVLKGNAATLEDYRYNLGLIEGLRRALAFVEEARQAVRGAPAEAQEQPLYPT